MLSRGRGRSRWLRIVQGLRSLGALSKRVKVLEEIQLTAFSGIGRGFVRSEGPEGHFTAKFILANGRHTGQQVFWNGSGTGNYRDFQGILTIFRTVPGGGAFGSRPRWRRMRG